MKKTLLSKNALRSLFWCFALLLLNTHMSWGKSAIAGINGTVACDTPTAFAVTGGGPYCSGGSGVVVGLANSQLSVNYQLKLDGMDSGSTVAGTGGVISFGNQIAGGAYTVVATNVSSGCSNTATMTGSAVVTINAVAGPETAIPDPNFEQALITLGLDCTADGKVFTSNISSETYLDVSGLGILDLTGIAAFASLQELYCENNSLTSLDVSALTNLVNLGMLGNQVTTLSAHPNLTYLDCDDNAFTTINVSGLPNLTDFYCSGNLLTSLDVRGLTNLQYFECKNNPNLSCILVDDVAAAYTATTTISYVPVPPAPFWAKDTAAIYSNCDCGNTTTWNGSWTNGAPTSTTSAIIAANYNDPANISACTLTVNNNAVVTIPSGSSVTLNGALTVSSGSFTLENNANLIQTTDVANSGNITVKRNSALQVRLDHTLWSSPVTGAQTLAGFSPNTLANRFYNFDTVTNKYTATPSTGTFTAGKGVAVRAPNDYTTTPTTFNGVFTGLPNNGPVAVALVTTTPGNNLVGNPYPSTIDAAAVVNVANNPNIGGTLYFYAHTLSMDTNGIFSAGTNYAVWNSGSGGTAATLGTSGVPANVPNGIIQAGQGFFVQATGTGNVNFTKAMRVNNTANQFFKTSSTKTEAIERHRIWLNLTNGAGTEFNQILVAYAAGATQDADRDYDGLAFGNTGSALSSKIAGAGYTIQGRALPFSADDVVALGFKAAADGNYTISLSAMDGLFLDSQEVFIRDNTTGKTQSLKGTPYTFTSTAGVYDTRFELLYSKTLGVSKPAFDTTGVVVYKKESAFHVNTNGIMMKEISVFDMKGRLIGKQSNINSTTSALSGLSGAHGVLLLKIVSDTNETAIIKVIN